VSFLVDDFRGLKAGIWKTDNSLLLACYFPESFLKLQFDPALMRDCEVFHRIPCSFPELLSEFAILPRNSMKGCCARIKFSVFFPAAGNFGIADRIHLRAVQSRAATIVVGKL
jgi:hypothetical protein